MLMPGRNGSTGEQYRFAFNGKEFDPEVAGNGNQYDYGFRIYNPRIGRFLSVDPLTASYPWYTPYQFAGNKPIRFIDLDGLEEANPSLFTKTINIITGDYHLNRLNAYLTKHNLTSENVVELQNDTYVVSRIVETSEGLHKTFFSVFRKSKRDGKVFSVMNSSNDDLELSAEEFASTEVVGERVLDSPFGGPALKGSKIVLNGSKDLTYVFRQTVGYARKVGSKTLNNWKAHIKFGVPDATGISKDLLTKGYHLHFKQLNDLELALKPGKNGKVLLAYISGNRNEVNKAVKIFNEAMENNEFKAKLLIDLKKAQGALQDAGKVLSNKDEAKMAVDKAHELNYIIKSIVKGIE